VRTAHVRHWHIDRLLAAGRVVDIQLQPNSAKTAECRLADMVRGWAGAEPVAGFGATDCRCGAHLARFPTRPLGSVLAPAVLPALPDMYRELRSRYHDYSREDKDPFQTLVACILSLRTQDPVTNAAANRLFTVLRTPREFAVADPARIAELIFPVGMYRQKALRLVDIARLILDRFGGQTPAAIDDLVSLPGVGRKTANLVRSFAFHLPAICVDTHVHRITNRWGLVRTATPDETETELRRVLPGKHWQETNALLVQHGQTLCRPTRPRCEVCALRGACRYDELLRHAMVLAGVPGAPGHPSLDLVAPAAAARCTPGTRQREPRAAAPPAPSALAARATGSPVRTPTCVALGLGANLGDPAATFRRAIAELRNAGLTDVRVSGLYRTDPVDCPPGTPAFTNAALTGGWHGTVRELLNVCKGIEVQMGRPARHGRNQSRTLDLDILMFGNERRQDADLTLPHPQLDDRLFVLAPLAEIAPDWRIPPPHRVAAADAQPDTPASRAGPDAIDPVRTTTRTVAAMCRVLHRRQAGSRPQVRRTGPFRPGPARA
jgi:endonuclease III/2-amino-4-hydroxy-6-hydroxymethyldihydropteridine diphosphokinase